MINSTFDHLNYSLFRANYPALYKEFDLLFFSTMWVGLTEPLSNANLDEEDLNRHFQINSNLTKEEFSIHLNILKFDLRKDKKWWWDKNRKLDIKDLEMIIISYAKFFENEKKKDNILTPFKKRGG